MLSLFVALVLVIPPLSEIVTQGRLDLWIHMKYNNNSDALWFNFCFLYRVRQYAAEHTVYVVTAIKSVAQSFLLMQARLLLSLSVVLYMYLFVLSLSPSLSLFLHMYICM